MMDVSTTLFETKPKKQPFIRATTKDDIRIQPSTALKCSPFLLIDLRICNHSLTHGVIGKSTFLMNSVMFCSHK